MKPLFSLLFFSILSISIYGQKKEVLSKKNQAAATHFSTEYKKKNYKKFEGKIVVKDNQVQFDDKVIFYDKSDKTTAFILQQGLIYPQLLTDYQMNKFLDETTDRTQKRFLKLQKDPRASFDVNAGSIKVSELSFLNSNEKTKRFELISKSKVLPSITYFIELQNSKATAKTSIEDFIKNSKLTYLQQD